MPPRRRQPRKRWQTRERNAPALVIIGFGRLGGALALALHRSGWPVTVLPRSDESVRRAAALGIPLADNESLSVAELCLFAVPDRTVASAAQTFDGDLGPHTAVIHCAGALSWSLLPAHRPRGSFHPLCAVSSNDDPLTGSVAISASSTDLNAQLQRMARAIELVPLTVPEDRRAVYHAGAVLSAGGVISLLSAAVACLVEAGIPSDEATAALVSLARSALSGAEHRSLRDALTGPIARGDAGVVAAHFEAIPEDIRPLYRELSERALRLVAERIGVEGAAAIQAALGLTR